MLELPGQPALSDFRVAKLMRALKRIDERVETLQARYVYFVSTNDELSREQRSRLDALLLSGESPAKFKKGTRNLFVVPRPGTISPWSSKATDIAKACDIDAVDRIERGICYAIKFSSKVGDDELMNVSTLLFDRMTDAVFTQSAQVESLFEAHEPTPVVTIALKEKGRDALVVANADLGLALSPGEIDYLVASYGELDRDPTDAELMMFAQASSEHCRHKIFNASWVIDGDQQD
jgi:phosphoribosylformylglycinamidine synthase